VSSGADLARGALAAARAAARKQGTGKPTKQKRLTAVQRGTGRDPVGLGATLAAIGAANGWDIQTRAGSITDRWPQIAPTHLVDLVRPEHYDPERRILHLRPATNAAASILRLDGGRLAKHLNTELGSDVVAGLRVLAVGPGQPTEQVPAESSAVPDGIFTAVKTPEPGPGVNPVYSPPTGAPPSQDMQAWRKTYREQRARTETTPPRLSSPWFEGAYGRLREPETAFQAVAAAPEDPAPVHDQAARSAASHARALAAARTRPRTGDPTPLRPAAGAA
jgi:hypothetical protein